MTCNWVPRSYRLHIASTQATATLMRAAATIVEHVRAILKVRHPYLLM